MKNYSNCTESQISIIWRPLYCPLNRLNRIKILCFLCIWYNHIYGQYSCDAGLVANVEAMPYPDRLYDQGHNNQALPEMQTRFEAPERHNGVIGGPCPPESACWSWQNPLPHGALFRDIFFLNGQTGWIVGEGGAILSTVDGGHSWTVQNAGIYQSLRGVFFIDAQNGWIAGLSGTILKTTDGGCHWRKINTGTTKHLTDIHFTDTQTGWAVGYSGAFLKTVNGGETWTDQVSKSTFPDAIAAHFINEKIGWVTGWFGETFTTADGGNSWLHKFTFGFHCFSIFLLDAQLGWVVGQDGLIYQTTDGGLNWKSQYVNTKAWLYDVQFMNPQNGYAVGWYGTILKTDNGGTNWKVLPSVTSRSLYALCFTDEQTGWAVGEAGTILKTEDGGNTWANKNIFMGLSDLEAVFFINAQNGWAIGNYTLMKTIDGGKHWTWSYLAKHSFNDIQFKGGGQIGWIVGGDYRILKTENGGNTWSEQFSQTGGNLNKVCFIDQETGWAVGTNGVILKSLLGGYRWVAQKSGVTSALNSVFFSTKDIGWVVGEDNKILKTTDGGETWVQQLQATPGSLWDVYFIDAKTGWAVGSNGLILKTNDGGTSWVQQDSGTKTSLTSVHFADSQTGWTAGVDAKIYGTIDGGQTWTRQIETTEPIHDLYFINAQTGWSVGKSANILHYASTTPLCIPSIPLHLQTTDPATKITWPAASGCTAAYRLSLGTTPGGSELLKDRIVTDTFYQPAQPLPAHTTIYVHIIPYNAAGEATGCTVFNFTTTSGCSTQISGPAVLCNGQAVSLDAGSGFDSYTWSNGATTQYITAGLPGIYNVTVTKGQGCVDTASKMIGEPVQGPTPSLANATLSICNALVELDAGNGYAGYSWSDGQRSQRILVDHAGTYSVTVTDAQGCSGTAATTMTQYARIDGLVLSTEGTECNLSNGSINLNVTGGREPFSFLWSNGATTQDIDQLKTGYYSVTVTDANNCTISDFRFVYRRTRPPSVSLSAKATCAPNTNNGAINVNASGTHPLSFTWSNGQSNQNLNNLPAGTYTLTVKDGVGCSTTATTFIRTLQPTSRTIDVTLCGGTRYLIDGKAFSEAGVYTVTISNWGGCDSVVTLNIKKIDNTINDDYIYSDQLTGVVAVLENDILLYSDTGRVFISRQPENGTAVVGPQGRVYYSFHPSRLTQDMSFEYIVCTDNCTCSRSARVSFIAQNVARLISNTLTLNGDGKNDIFDPVNDLNKQGFMIDPEYAELRIFNRAGEVIFAPSHYQPWEGPAIKPVAPESYYYILRLTEGDKVEVLKGALTIL